MVAKSVEQALHDLAESLQISEAKLEAAETSYKSVGEWLNRPESTLADWNPEVYSQGSFRLGTVIKPTSSDQEYDVDIVCELEFQKGDITQADLKKKLGKELIDYARSKNMQRPDDKRRCWTLNYAESARFHLDALPAIPDGERSKLILDHAGRDFKFAEGALSITDQEDPDFKVISFRWPHSNPKGFAEWFKSRQESVFGRLYEARLVKDSVEKIPDWKVKTPLQYVVQILKHHRDQVFNNDEDDIKPASIIITTLAAIAYNQEETLTGALRGILDNFEAGIQSRNGIIWIPNPADPIENFADRWRGQRKKREAFDRWLGIARTDFARFLSAENGNKALSELKDTFGNTYLSEAVLAARQRSGISVSFADEERAGFHKKIPISPEWRKEPPWPRNPMGSVEFERVVYKDYSGMTRHVTSDDPIRRKNIELAFRAITDVPEPYDVFWQVVNQGDEASQNGQLRGGFDVNSNSRNLVRTETGRYVGRHSIECFIIKDGCLAARSGQFIVNIVGG